MVPFRCNAGEVVSWDHDLGTCLFLLVAGRAKRFIEIVPSTTALVRAARRRRRRRSSSSTTTPAAAAAGPVLGSGPTREGGPTASPTTPAPAPAPAPRSAPGSAPGSALGAPPSRTTGGRRRGRSSVSLYALSGRHAGTSGGTFRITPQPGGGCGGGGGGCDVLRELGLEMAFRAGGGGGGDDGGGGGGGKGDAGSGSGGYLEVTSVAAGSQAAARGVAVGAWLHRFEGRRWPRRGQRGDTRELGALLEKLVAPRPGNLFNPRANEDKGESGEVGGGERPREVELDFRQAVGRCVSLCSPPSPECGVPEVWNANMWRTHAPSPSLSLRRALALCCLGRHPRVCVCCLCASV